MSKTTQPISTRDKKRMQEFFLLMLTVCSQSPLKYAWTQAQNKPE